MSLFGSLFGSKPTSGGLFSEASKYKSHHEQQEPDEEPTASAGKLKDRQKRKSAKRAAEAASADSKGDAAAGAAALTLQTGITAAKAAQMAADDGEVPVDTRKRRKLDKKDKHSKKASKTAADSSPTAVVEHQQDEQTHEQPRDQQAVGVQALKKHKRPKNSALQGGPQLLSATAAPAQQQTEAAEDAADGSESLAASQHQRLSPEEEAEKLSRTVFVGNLPVDIKHKQLMRLFSAYGEVDSVRLRSVPLDLESKKKLPRKAAVIKGVVSSDRGGTNAYIVFKEAAAAAAALAVNMTEVADHHIRVDRAAPPSAARADGAAAGAGRSSVLYDPVRSVFVGNLEFKVTEEDLIRTFSNGDLQPELAAAVEAVRVVRDPETNLGKGIAYVLFKTKAAARAALQLDGQKLGKRAIRVSRVDKRASPAAGYQQHSPSAAAGGKRLKDRHSMGSGVKQGGVQNFTGTHNKRGFGNGAAADWQGLRTKGKGAGFRSAGRVGKPSGERSGNPSGGSKPAVRGAAGSNRVKAKAGSKGSGFKKSGGKRPAVAARKEKANAAAKRFAR